MNDDALKLTIYAGERDRAGGRFLADALIDVLAEHRLRTSLLLRGMAGFGAKQHLHTDRVLSLSEDVPIVAIAVDRRAAIERALEDVRALRFDGLVTLERARLDAGDLGDGDGDGDVKLTVHLGRQERADGHPAFEAVVDLLHRHGVAGATVLLGVDGTVDGIRRRARFAGGNADVPLMVVSVGAAARMAVAVQDLRLLLERPLMTLERVRVCKRDGRLLAEPPEVPATDASGLALWQKVMVYASEQSRHEGRPLYAELLRELRRSRAAGVTVLRGIWGYHGDHVPHGDVLWQLRRRVPVLIVAVDAPAAVQRWWPIVDALTRETGLVTSEVVPAFRATGPAGERGGLRLAPRWSG